MRMRKPTQMHRATVTQEYRQILGPESEVKSGGYRRVQILIPPSPSIVGILTPDMHWQLKPNDNVMHKLGANRSYKGTILPADTMITIALGPDQTLWAAAEEGLGEVGLIIEYLEG